MANYIYCLYSYIVAHSNMILKEYINLLLFQTHHVITFILPDEDNHSIIETLIAIKFVNNFEQCMSEY